MRRTTRTGAVDGIMENARPAARKIERGGNGCQDNLKGASSLSRSALPGLAPSACLNLPLATHRLFVVRHPFGPADDHGLAIFFQARAGTPVKLARWRRHLSLLEGSMGSLAAAAKSAACEVVALDPGPGKRNGCLTPGCGHLKPVGMPKAIRCRRCRPIHLGFHDPLVSGVPIAMVNGQNKGAIPCGQKPD